MAPERPAVSLDTLDITDTSLYVQNGYPWEAWDLLRAKAPVFWYERPGFEPFWAITKHEDVAFISHHPELFSNRQRLRLSDIEGIEIGQRSRQRSAAKYGHALDDPPDLVFMDPPQHRTFRGFVNRSFTPRTMEEMEPHFDDLSKGYVAHFGKVLAERFPRGETVDFVHELACKLPVAAICEMADVPRDDWDKIFRWTEVLVGAGDPEYQLPGESREQALRRVDKEWDAYTNWMIDRRIEDGAQGPDLVSLLVRARYKGEPLTRRELLSYINLLLAAGNETTRNAMTGGVKALLDHPDQLELLVKRPELVDSAVEEILRWTSIIIQFARTATQDVEIRGTTIRAGQTVGMFYPSANRDEDVFADPYAFDITRDPNPHFTFGGYGEHFCLGANLARWELKVMFREMLPLLPKMELAGKPELVAQSLHVGGIKRLPVRLNG
ncbi:MAG: cytochrome P450 [Dehalococcoidia bacterium]